jgi:hypothetical protein
VIAVTPDGDLTEWAAQTPIVLSGGVATYIAPNIWTHTPTVTPTGTPPTATPTVTGTPNTPVPTPTPHGTPAIIAWYYCAYPSTNYLAIAGQISDTTPFSPTYQLEFGDASEIIIDGLNDKLYGTDSHDLLIGINGLTSDFGNPYTNTLIATTSNADGWKFEALLPTSWLKSGSLTAGEIVSLLFGYYDRISTSTRAYGLWTHWYAGVMQ